MIEVTGDLFEYVGSANAIGITTNGFVKNDGRCVMGRGCAKKAVQYWPTIAKILGSAIKKNGNIVNMLGTVEGTYILSFPVKPIVKKFDGTNAVKYMSRKFKINNEIPGWACLADPVLIEQSAKQLVELTNKNGWSNVILPRPGCGAGELNWVNVKSILEKYFNNRFYSITFK